MRRMAWVLVLALAACGGNSTGIAPDDQGGEDVAADVPVDTPADVPVDTPADVPVDTPADVPVDIPAFVGPLDNVLRLNHIQVKGTHNSYHVESEGAMAQWKYTHAPLDVQLQDQGIRQVELDVHWDSDLLAFTVHHIPLADPGTTCATFKECLTILKTWSDAHPGHQVLYVLVEPKDDVDEEWEKIVGHYADLDAEILSVWPRQRLVVPDDVRGARATVAEALQKDGWPTLGSTRSKAFFILLDTSEHRDNYLLLHPNSEGGVFFLRGEGGEPWCGVIENGNPVRDEAEIQANVAAGYLQRTSPDGVGDSDASNQAGADAAQRLGAHIISTDYPVQTAAGAYWFDLAGGTPSRCNPVTAPPECTSEAIENLAAIH